MGLFRHATFLVFLGILGVSYAYAELEIAEEAEARARQNLIQRFSEFTKEKNVMGKANSISGEVLKAKGKTRFNNDDKNNFENDLTYHKYTYEIQERLDPKDPKSKKRKLPEWISDHGKVSQAGGSSQLERTVYKQHEKFMKQQEDPNKDKNKKPEKGVEYESIYKITTVDVKENPNDPNSRPYSVTKTEIVDEAKQEIEKVGTNAGEAVIKAGKESEFRNDANTLPNISFLYESARRGVEAMWNSATANLAQRRANKVIQKSRLAGSGVNEGMASCDKWGQTILKASRNNPDFARVEKQVQEQVADCKLMMSKNYKDINPEIESKKDRDGNTQKSVKNGDVKSEDDKERDLRMQLNVLNQAGIRLNEVESNWNYTEKDEKSKVVTSFDDSGKANKEQELRVDEQLDLYNKELEEAAKDYADVQKRLPENLQIDPKQITNYQIKPKSKRIDQIMEITPSQAEEFGLQKGPSQQKLPEYYEELQSKK